MSSGVCVWLAGRVDGSTDRDGIGPSNSEHSAKTTVELCNTQSEPSVHYPYRRLYDSWCHWNCGIPFEIHWSVRPADIRVCIVSSWHLWSWLTTLLNSSRLSDLSTSCSVCLWNCDTHSHPVVCQTRDTTASVV